MEVVLGIRNEKNVLWIWEVECRRIGCRI